MIHSGHSYDIYTQRTHQQVLLCVISKIDLWFLLLFYFFILICLLLFYASVDLFWYDVQNIFQVVNEIRNPLQSRIDKVTGMSLGTALAVYTLVAVAGFSTYGDAVESNILISYPSQCLIIYTIM
jgi:amino acid permease